MHALKSASSRLFLLFLTTLASIAFSQEVPLAAEKLFFCYDAEENAADCSLCFDAFLSFDSCDCNDITDSCDCPGCVAEEDAFLASSICDFDSSCEPSGPPVSCSPGIPCNEAFFCNFDDGIDVGGFCEPCRDSMFCAADGLPDAGVEDCLKVCGTSAPDALNNCYLADVGACSACREVLLNFGGCYDVTEACDCPGCVAEEEAFFDYLGFCEPEPPAPAPAPGKGGGKGGKKGGKSKKPKSQKKKKTQKEK